jgi:hypothetical protein
MAHTIPNAATFKARHPRFAALADATVDLLIAEAARTVTTDWAEEDYADGIMYLAAHLIVMEGLLDPTGTALGVGNQIKKTKAGEVEVEFATDAAPSGNGNVRDLYSRTSYGKRYLELAARNGGLCSPAVLVV